MVKCEKLKGKLVEAGMSQNQIADFLGVNATTVNHKVNGKTEFKASEMKKLSEKLRLSAEEFNDIFFAQ